MIHVKFIEVLTVMVCCFIIGVYTSDWVEVHVLGKEPPRAEVKQITPEQAEVLHDKLNHIIDELALQEREESMNERTTIGNQIEIIQIKKELSLLEARIIHLEK